MEERGIYVAEDKKVTPLSEVLEQLKPEVITIPGFRPGSTLNVKVKYVDLTLAILETNISNPLIALAYQRAQEGKTRAEIEAEINKGSENPVAEAEKVLKSLNALAKEALVEPTYDELTGVAPLTTEQLAAIYLYMLYGERGEGLAPFRGKPRIHKTG